MQTDATGHNIVACCWGFLANNELRPFAKSLTGFKLYATSANIVVILCKRTQHVGPNNVACCWPTMLRPFAWALSPPIERWEISTTVLTSLSTDGAAKEGR